MNIKRRDIFNSVIFPFIRMCYTFCIMISMRVSFRFVMLMAMMVRYNGRFCLPFSETSRKYVSMYFIYGSKTHSFAPVGWRFPFALIYTLSLVILLQRKLSWTIVKSSNYQFSFPFEIFIITSSCSFHLHCNSIIFAFDLFRMQIQIRPNGCWAVLIVFQFAFVFSVYGLFLLSPYFLWSFFRRPTQNPIFSPHNIKNSHRICKTPAN